MILDHTLVTQASSNKITCILDVEIFSESCSLRSLVSKIKNFKFFLFNNLIRNNAYLFIDLNF